jgi:type I restriction enzyme M protein
MRSAQWNGRSLAARGARNRIRAFDYEQLVQRDKANLDIFWLRDESLEGSQSLQPPDVIAAKIVENLEAALEQFRKIYEELGASPSDLARTAKP